MRHFTPPESYGYLATVTDFDKFYQLFQLNLVITFFRSRPEFDFLNLHLALLLTLIVQLLLLLKSELAIIHQTADRRFGIGYQFYEIQLGLFGELFRLFQ